MDDKEKLEQLKEGVLKPDEKLQKFDDHGITEDFLMEKLKGELDAEKDKEPIWKIQQDARKDAHKLRGDYPAEKHEHTGDVIFRSNVPEPDMPEEEKDKPASEDKNYNPKPSGEEMKKHLNEWIDNTTNSPNSTAAPIDTTDTKVEGE